MPIARGEAESAHAASTDEAVTIDGYLDEASWSSAIPVTRFFEIYPANVGVPPVTTEARFLYDERSIYVGIRAHDPHPSAIRYSLVRRDGVSSDQDYVELLLDSQGRRNGAMRFRTNARGVATDAQYDEHTQRSDFSPDFNFDVAAAIHEDGWSAEFRIPLSTLRYQKGSPESWKFVVYRNLPREITTSIASIPVPRAANCTMCLAGELVGIGLDEEDAPLYLTPYATHETAIAETGPVTSRSRESRVGLDAKWQPDPRSVADFTLNPDFSQVEADALQLSANSLFALAAAEKRPFFLEGTDVLATPITATYTRAFADPSAGARFTRRGDGRDYTALLVRDGPGAFILEPGARFSRLVSTRSESTAAVARYRRHGDASTLGVIGSARAYDEGGRNLVVGADGTWAPSMSDRLTTQLLWSVTDDPKRPDLVPTWTGKRVHGGAGLLSWSRVKDEWTGSVSHSVYTEGFRAWNGFIGQADVSRTSASAGLKFHPDHPFVVRVSPAVSFSRADEIGGPDLSRSWSTDLTVEMAHGTALSIAWNPKAKSITLAGPRYSDSLSVGLSTTPAAWMPGISLSLAMGDGFDALTGEIGDLMTWGASVPLRLFGRFELNAAAAHQSLESRRADAAGRTLFDETNLQLSALWHLSSRVYVQGEFLTTRLRRPNETSTTELSSALLSYRTDWQTRYFIGFRRASDETDSAAPGHERLEVFAKFSHVFAL